MKEALSSKFANNLYNPEHSLGRDEGYSSMELDQRQQSYDFGIYTQPHNNSFHHYGGSHLFGESGHNQLEDETDKYCGKNMHSLMPTQTLIPINHHFSDINPTFVNPKQYEAIMRRRMKKMKQQRALGFNRMRIKKKFKYETRSNHAKNRKRAKDGKFLSGPEQNDARTVSTVLRPQDEEPTEERVPCCAEEEQEDRRKREIDEKEAKVKLEMDHEDNISMNSDDLLGPFKVGSKKVSRREHPHDHSMLEEGPSLRRNDSLFDTKR